MSTPINNTLERNAPTVAQLAIEQSGALAVFTKYNIDYCCGGHRSLEEACHRIGLNPEKVRAEIDQAAASEPTEAWHPERWSSTLLVDYIIETHHNFVKRAIPELEALLDKVCDRHGNDWLELLKIRESFLDLSEDLTDHLEKEERVLFPAIKRLDAQKSQGVRTDNMIQGPIFAMEDEHQLAGDIVKQIRTLSNNYTPPDFACPTFRVTFQRLKEFDADLMRHIHLENNILFERYKNTAASAPMPSSCSL